MHLSTATRVASAAGAITLLAGLAVISPAYAAGPNHGRVWESGPYGYYVNAEVYIQPSYNDSGKHAVGARVHIWRGSGPKIDVWGYTPTATSRDESRILHVKKTVKDSVLPGVKYRTYGNYKTSWFSSGGGGCVIDEWSPTFISAEKPASMPDVDSLPADPIPAAEATSDVEPSNGPPPC